MNKKNGGEGIPSPPFFVLDGHSLMICFSGICFMARPQANMMPS